MPSRACYARGCTSTCRPQYVPTRIAVGTLWGDEELVAARAQREEHRAATGEHVWPSVVASFFLHVWAYSLQLGAWFLLFQQVTQSRKHARVHAGNVGHRGRTVAARHGEVDEQVLQ